MAARVRTPRKRKDWAIASSNTSVAHGNVGAPFVVDDLLEDYKSIRGVNELQGVTAVRTIVDIAIEQNVTTTTDAHYYGDWGIAWLPPTIVSTGGAAVPTPLLPGGREIRWVWTHRNHFDTEIGRAHV